MNVIPNQSVNVLNESVNVKELARKLINEYHRKYYADHREVRNAYCRKHYAEHREQIRKYQKEWRAKHPEKQKEYDKRYWFKKAMELRGAE